MSYPTAIPNHIQLSLGRTAAQIKLQVNWQKLAAALVGELQDIETNALFSLLAGRELATATGATLDNIGTILGQARQGRTDSVYRLWLQARVLLDDGSGTIPQILAIFTLLGLATTILWETPPRAFMLYANQPTTDVIAAELDALLQQARDGGVRAFLVYSPSAPSAVFTLDGTLAQAIDNGVLATGLG